MTDPAEQVASRLKAWLKAHASASDAMTLQREQVQALLESLQHLRQSNDRLRKQNKKVRVRVQRLKAGMDDPESPQAEPNTADSDLP